MIEYDAADDTIVGGDRVRAVMRGVKTIEGADVWDGLAEKTAFGLVDADFDEIF